MGTGILSCVVIASLLGAASGRYAGREFVATFLENLSANYKSADLELLITARKPSTSVTISAPNFHLQLTLPTALRTVSVAIPAIELNGTKRSNHTVRISASHPVTVSSFSKKNFTTEGSVLYPVRSLGTDYLIFTPPTSSQEFRKEFAVSNAGEADNPVVLTLTKALTFEGQAYQRGDSIRLTLGPYETVQFQHEEDLTGSRVQSERPVAVVAGHSCSKGRSKCNHVYEQLPPVSEWGDSFVIAPSAVQTTSDLVYVLTSQNTELTEGLYRQVKVPAFHTRSFSVSKNLPLALRSSHPVLVLFYSPGVKPNWRRRNAGYDPYLMTVMPNRDFATSYVVRGLDGFENHISLVARASETSKLRLDGQPLTDPEGWATMKGSEYFWIDLTTSKNNKTHLVTADGEARFGVYQYGVSTMDAYGYQGIPTGGDDFVADPCSGVQCQSLETCEMGVCVPIQFRICERESNFKYLTFDRKSFNFQGTCTYIIAKTCSNPDAMLPQFAIRAKDVHRGDSFVTMVTIEVYGIEIVLGKLNPGFIEVDGFKTNLPVSLHEGSVSVFEAATGVKLETDFHMHLYYEWNILEVRVGSGHAGALCGLCGNFNGNPDDDLQTPAGTVLSNTQEFGASWKVADGDPACGNPCDDQRMKKYEDPQFCGLMSLPTGPFSECLAKVDPTHYVSQCVHDVCPTEDQALFCQALEVYAEACQREGVSLANWRNVAKCPVLCSGVQCQSFETCEMGVCVPDYPGVCYRIGDSEYGTFDEKKFNFQGTCTYIIAKTCSNPDAMLPQFAIRAKDVHRGDSFVTMVTIEVYGIEIVLGKLNPGFIEVDGFKTNLPVNLHEGRVYVFESEMGVKLETDFHMNLYYKGNMIIVTVGRGHAGALCGLCGNFNGNPDDDLQTPAGTVLSNTQEFGASWKVADGDPACGNPCDDQRMKKYEDSQFCGLMSLPTGPFSECLAEVDPTHYVSQCVHDVCPTEDQALFCQALEVYAEACQREGVSLANWRNVAKCPDPCSEVQCQSLETCEMGVCVPDYISDCLTYSDFKYLTFDGKSFNFQGNCTYIIAKTCSNPDALLPQFAIQAKDVHRGDSFVKMVTIEVYGIEIVLGKLKPGLIEVDGFKTNLPVNLHEGRVSVFESGMGVKLEIDFNVHLYYEWNMFVLTVGSGHAGALCGLCGNFNGKSYDDLQTPAGTVLSNTQEFGASWKVADGDPACGNPCDDQRMKKYEDSQFCGLMSHPTGPFSECLAEVDPTHYVSQCVHDVCPTEDQALFCQALEVYAEACQRKGVSLDNWRNVAKCPLDCPPHSHYELCADTCQSTCASLTEHRECPSPCFEGCVCDSGFLLKGDRCVPDKECGCLGNGHYYQLGETVVQDMCTQRCSCSLAGLTCKAMSCATEEHCVVKNGVLGCYKDPCKEAHCREKEDCQVENGEALCVANFTSRCWAWGDPHYYTFDGFKFDFQGTCTYVVAETRGSDTSLPPFRVTAKNDLRGSTAVSFVKLVHVDVYGYRISIHKSEMGLVRVDGIKTQLPMTLEGGRLRLSQQGTSAEVDTDFGLRVFYDWNWFLLVTLSSSYFRNVCGLCGNFNGIESDDMFFPNSTQAPSVLEWARSWKVKDRDPFCWDHCMGSCPTCLDADKTRYAGPDFCGMLEDVFGECHPKVDHKPFMDNCIYDVCLYQGSRLLLCQALQAYATECQHKGIMVTNWRTRTSCPKDCPLHSHYEECGRACPPSCEDPEGTSPCPRPCIETCTCDEGRVMVEGKCQPVEEACGCVHSGLRYRPGQVFWPGAGCGLRCVCRPRTQQADCEERRGCGPGEICSKQGCLPAGRASCSARGYPHYYTFDGVRFDFMGTCVYQFAGLCKDEGGRPRREGLVPFQVRVRNQHRGNTAVSYTHEVTLLLNGTSLALSAHFPWRVLVDGVLYSLPAQVERAGVWVQWRGRAAELQTDFGLILTFDWDSWLTLSLPSTYTGAVCGLCGNYDGWARGDLILPDGREVDNAQAFGIAWEVERTPGCVSGCTGNCPHCSSAKQRVYAAPDLCGRLISKLGPFRDCHAKVDPDPYYQDCLFDLCLNGGRQDILCEALGIYTAACQMEGAEVHPWRGRGFCELSCPAHSSYVLCGSPCPTSCASLRGWDTDTGGNEDRAVCGGHCLEGCQCEEGYLLEAGGECVHHSRCGCFHRGSYLRQGEVSYQEPVCRSKCKCLGGGQMQCQPHHCRVGEGCQLRQGKWGCFPEGGARCIASGDPHYLALDGKHFQFSGSCAYLLSGVKDGAGSGGLPHFSVKVENRPWGGRSGVNVTRRVMVLVAGHHFILEPGVRGRVKVDEEWFNLPVQLSSVGEEEEMEEVWVELEGHRTVLRASFSLEVAYDGLYQVDIWVPSTYRRQLGGLCGDYTGTSSADFALPDGKTTRNVTHFGEAWQDKGAVGCTHGCGSSCFTCAADHSQLFAGRAYCGRIKDLAGPFSLCLSKVDPTPFFQECVFDLCAAQGKQDVLCRAMRAFAVACQLEGISIQAWRSKDFCPLSCPANSHYELCANTCGTGCASTITSTPCDHHCSEGCQCDPGFALSGADCVPIESCGCVYHGRYLKVNETIYTANCTEICTCISTGTVSCQNVQCLPPSACELRHGQRGCYRNRVCSIEEDRTLNVFMDQVVPVEMVGTFILATVSNPSFDPWFRLLVDFKACDNSKEPQLLAVYAYFKGAFVVVTNGENAWVNGRQVRRDQLPLKPTAQLSIRMDKGSLVLDLADIVQLQFRGARELLLMVDRSLRGQLQGTCGPLQEGGGDLQLLLPDGQLADSVQKYFSGWRAAEFSGCATSAEPSLLH
ncbi:IgGFc-binding protein-like [Hemitrygon akajei]|uniref:IgGFc-binding protein-like n=1 Tax=Hemitrygon akajei TaxID=2704970 RepID=UPI003BF9986D